MTAGRRGRWTWRWATPSLALVVMVTPIASWWAVRSAPAEVALHAASVARGAGGRPVPVAAGEEDRLVPGSRVLRGPGDGALVEAERAWLARGSLPGRDPRERALARDALLDLHVLTGDRGATVAGWSPPWRHVWPRDASFAVAALAATGHPDDALNTLEFLQAVQPGDGLFHARYLPDGSGVPDDRGVQLDGTGWVLWAIDRVLADLPEPERPAVVARLGPLIERSTRAAERAVANRDRLPPPSPDYWEVPERRLTLGTAAPLLAGLQAAARIQAVGGNPERAASLRATAEQAEAAIHERFGPRGYPRHAGGRERDAAVTFLLPPFVDAAHPDVVAARAAAGRELSRPAGGLAPGAGWKDDGISWTPETALFALSAAATCDVAAARSWLGWLDRHRTAAGSFPEKVLHDGRPASVAPLAWTAALVLLTLTEVDRC